MFELYMRGTDCRGIEYPRRYMMGLCVNALIGEYLNIFPTVVHVQMDVAIDQTGFVKEILRDG